MVTHIVLFKLIDRSPSDIEKTREALLNMKGKIPQLRHIEVGVDIVRSPRSYDLALITKFDSLKEMEAYQTDPAHIEVLKYISSVKESSISVDYQSQ